MADPGSSGTGFREQSRRRLRSGGISWGSRLGMLVFSVVSAFLLAEAGLRLTEYRYIGHSAAVWPDGYFQGDPILGADQAREFPPAPFVFRGPTHEIFTNSLGCFDRERSVEPGYILVLGDSFAWGYQRLEEKWTSRLEEMSGRQVLKCGVAGTGPRDQLIRGRRIIEQVGRPPAMILLLYLAVNDLNDDAVFPGYVVVDGQRLSDLTSLDLRTGEIVRESRDSLAAHLQGLRRRSWKHWLVHHSVIAALVANFRSPRQPSATSARPTPDPMLRSRYGRSLLAIEPGEFPWLDRVFAEHLETLGSFQSLAAEEGAIFVFATLNLRDEGYHRPLRRYLERSVPLHLDLSSYLVRERDGRRLTHRFDGHWNRLGNELAAQGIAEYLTQAGVAWRDPR